jgi:hypothetical protein
MKVQTLKQASTKISNTKHNAFDKDAKTQERTQFIAINDYERVVWIDRGTQQASISHVVQDHLVFGPFTGQ